jgi:hypothetical protein cdivTM_27693
MTGGDLVTAMQLLSSSEDALTSNFVVALESLSRTTSWQGEFAQVFAPANLVVA